ncbi:unnamed protein product [Rotaria sordida]|uniref:TauD/TfdA-like domain-containing protein n=1 Tax=Rotaria sordida TaxID=392033 RepID=A0A815VN74_9BILA|nr:unnamed protein product [Rotaria sordida]CAF1537393.1 unnamed protein product [Rotaria sordida]
MTTSQQLNIEVLTPSIGAVIHNLDLSQPLTKAQKDALEQALYKYHVLFFRNQNLTPIQQRDFARLFGEPHVHPIFLHTTECPEVSVLEYGLDIDPNKKPDSDIWHTDATWSTNPPIVGMLYAKIVPKQGGGDTLWANMIEIYKKELSNEMKAILSTLVAEHSFAYAYQPLIKPDSASMEQFMKTKETNPPVKQPVIREHPHTKEKYLYVNKCYTTKISELNEQESDLLLQYLFSLINKRPEFTCRWKWNENDVCLWDERTTQHYATADYWPQHRRMHRCVMMENKDKI